MSGFNTIPPNPFPPSTDEDGTQAAQIKHLQEDVSTLQGNVSTLSTTKANPATIAPSFSAETSYSVDDIVYYEGAAYRCTTAHTGAWDANDFAATTIAGEISDVKGDVSDLETTKANQITIAPTFSDSASYDVGDIVYYNGLSYRCTNAHEGAWDASDFAATTIAGELNGLNSNITPQLVTTVALASGLSGAVTCVKIGKIVMVSGYCSGTIAQNDEIIQNLPAYRADFGIQYCRYPAILDGNTISPMLFTATNALSVITACTSVNFFVMYVTN